MRSLRTRRFSGVIWLGLGLVLTNACSAGNASNTSGVRAAGGDSTGATGGAGTATAGSGTGNTGNINTGNTGGADADAGCQHREYNFVPKIPNVFVLVDRSGSMFDSMAWDPLKAGVLAVVMQLQDKI